MTRAYLRLDPGFYERKLDQGYSLEGAVAEVEAVLRSREEPEVLDAQFLLESASTLSPFNSRSTLTSSDGW